MLNDRFKKRLETIKTPVTSNVVAYIKKTFVINIFDIGFYPVVPLGDLIAATVSHHCS